MTDEQRIDLAKLKAELDSMSDADMYEGLSYVFGKILGAAPDSELQEQLD